MIKLLISVQNCKQNFLSKDTHESFRIKSLILVLKKDRKKIGKKKKSLAQEIPK